MKPTTVIIPLDELLEYLVPDSEEAQKPAPTLLEKQAENTPHAAFSSQVPLSLCLKTSEEEIRLRGTADAVWKIDGNYIIEETLLWDPPNPLSPALRKRSLLRAKLFCLALANQKALPHVTLRLSTFVQGRVEQEEYRFEKEDLSLLLHGLAPDIFSLSFLWAKPESQVVFPYRHLRQGQKDLIRAVWRAIGNGTKLYACAPTGIGKTLAVFYPALRALEKGKIDQICYASPKNTLKTQAAQAVEHLQNVRGMRTLVLNSRFSLCPEKNEECRREECAFRDQIAQKLPDALRALAAFSCITEKELTQIAAQFSLCPFELARHMQKYAQVIIADYNHVFDPDRMLLKPKKNSVLLIDEAHNLPTRMQESYSETLSPKDFDFFFRDSSLPSAMLREHFSPLLALFTKVEKQRKETKVYHSFEVPEAFFQNCTDLLKKVAFALHDGFGVLNEETKKKTQELFGKLKKIRRLSRLYNEDFATLFPPEGGVRIYLLNPRKILLELSRSWRSSVFFSATLLPENYYHLLLGGTEEDLFLNLPSPFEREHLFVGLCDVDVSFRQRFLTAPKICSIIHAATSSKEGNYMVFLPSFDYLKLVVQEYKSRYFHDRILVQDPVMTPKKRNEFLETFQKNRMGKLIGFCVLGGIFSEGVDLKGEALSGEIIVGTGFPPPSVEAEAESEAYYKKEMDGKNFAYTLPGFSRVLQAAGRVIRSESDRGFLILCDSRYCTEEMRELFPEQWEGANVIPGDVRLKKELEAFWK